MRVPMAIKLILLPLIQVVSSDKTNQQGTGLSRVWQSPEIYRLLDPLLAWTDPSQVFGYFGFIGGVLCVCVCVCVLLLLFFLGPNLWHMEVPRWGVKSEPQPLAYATATATQDSSQVCDLYHSSQQHRILNPLIEARIEPTSSWILVGFVTAEPQQELLVSSK